MIFSLRKGRWALLLTAFFISPGYGQERLKLCAECHGQDGNSTRAGIPSIAGQPRTYMENQLVLAREGLRGAKEMQDALRGVTDKEIVQLAQYFAAQQARSTPGAVDKKIFDRGAAAAKNLRCGVCHLPDFSGRAQMPRLAGQREDYLLETMKTFRDKPRAGGDTIMSDALRGVSDADIKALAHYLSRSRSDRAGGRAR